MSAASAFWHTKSLAEMSPEQWEMLCDGCGKCCLHKLEDEDTGERYLTSVACAQLDTNTCRCKVYEERLKHVPNCVQLRQENLDELDYMPTTCAYRLIRDGEALPDWHPLVSGSKSAIHAAHASVRDKCISENEVDDDDLELYIVEVI